MVWNASIFQMLQINSGYMDLQRKALYNLLRMNWQSGQQSKVESWQIEDFRKKDLKALFHELDSLGVQLDPTHFEAYASNCDSPEELVDYFVNEHTEPKQEDHIYLILFELWRRLLPEQPSLSIFCDQLDHDIYLYDRTQNGDIESLQTTLASLQAILENSTDRQEDPIEAFKELDANCANDLESFLYDFISDMIDQEDETYASELIDGFYPYVPDKKWFDLLKAHLKASLHPFKARSIINELIDNEEQQLDAEFALEVLQFLSRWGDSDLFYTVTDLCISLIKTEDEFQDLLQTCSNFFQGIDRELEDNKIQAILSKRSKNSIDQPFRADDPDAKALLELLK